MNKQSNPLPLLNRLDHWQYMDVARCDIIMVGIGAGLNIKLTEILWQYSAGVRESSRWANWQSHSLISLSAHSADIKTYFESSTPINRAIISEMTTSTLIRRKKSWKKVWTWSHFLVLSVVLHFKVLPASSCVSWCLGWTLAKWKSLVISRREAKWVLSRSTWVWMGGKFWCDCTALNLT